MALTAAERQRRYRQLRKEKGERDKTRDHQKRHRQERTRHERLFSAPRPFAGCDGEGWGVDSLGRQNYMLFRMGDRELFTGAPLTTEELLDFICEHNDTDLLVGFSFVGYDGTMILRDLTEDRRAELFMPIERDPEKRARIKQRKGREPRRSPFVWYKDFGLEYLKGNYFRVCRFAHQYGSYVERTTKTGKTVREWKADPNGERVYRAVEGSARTIWETFGNFQKSFVVSLETFGIGSAGDRERIDANKKERGKVPDDIDETRAYCALECKYLAELMEHHRNNCHAAGIYPHNWAGAGKLASALHTDHDTPTRDEIEGGRGVRGLVPGGVVQFARLAYYGGRFEIARTGHIGREIHEYDINSAYPDGIRRGPCLRHGKWKKADAAALRRHRGLYLAECTFKGPYTRDNPKRIGALGGLPFRSREMRISWPNQGAGVYWSVEIESARKLGFAVTLKHGWTYHDSGCACGQYDWIDGVYENRLATIAAHGGNKATGHPLKIASASLYGKQAQRIGNPRFGNPISASFTTAITRARLNEAIAAAGHGNVVMIATDGIYSLAPIPGLDVGPGLGQWEHNVLPDLFIVQPGLYWCPSKIEKKHKSRGLPGKFFGDPDKEAPGKYLEGTGRTKEFENVWRKFDARDPDLDDRLYPRVPVQVPCFTGLRLANARGKPETAGKWTTEERQFSFSYKNKRDGHKVRDGHIETGIKPGIRGAMSFAYKDALESGEIKDFDDLRDMLEANPDFIDLGPPFQG